MAHKKFTSLLMDATRRGKEADMDWSRDPVSSVVFTKSATTTTRKSLFSDPSFTISTTASATTTTTNGDLSLNDLQHPSIFDVFKEEKVSEIQPPKHKDWGSW